MINTPLNICGEVVLRIHHHLLRKDRTPRRRAKYIRTPRRWRSATNG